MAAHRESTETSASALLLVDVINRMDFPEGPALLRQALRIADTLVRLKRRWQRARLPVVYANDNHGQWRSNFSQVVAACVADDAPGAAFVRQLRPDPDDYFVLKPQQSAFFASPLHDLLDHLRVRRLVIAGLAGDGCVLATAIDANMRGFHCHVPADCTASPTLDRNRRALRILKDAMRISVGASRTVRPA